MSSRVLIRPMPFPYSREMVMAPSSQLEASLLQIHSKLIFRILDRNGTLDLLVGSTSGFNIFYGNGTTVAATSGIRTGDQPVDVETGDINRDGKVDILTVNRGEQTISITLSNGDGTFKNRISLSAGVGVDSARLSDINNDGKLDIVALNQGSDSAYVYLGNGDGTFSLQSTTITLQAGSSIGGSIRTWAYTPVDGGTTLLSTGTFAASTSFSAGSTPLDVVSADVNGDGVIDLISAAFGTDTAQVMLGNGDGTLVELLSPPRLEQIPLRSQT